MAFGPVPIHYVKHPELWDKEILLPLTGAKSISKVATTKNDGLLKEVNQMRIITTFTDPPIFFYEREKGFKETEQRTFDDSDESEIRFEWMDKSYCEMCGLRGHNQNCCSYKEKPQDYLLPIERYRVAVTAQERSIKVKERNSNDENLKTNQYKPQTPKKFPHKTPIKKQLWRKKHPTTPELPELEEKENNTQIVSNKSQGDREIDTKVKLIDKEGIAETQIETKVPENELEIPQTQDKSVEGNNLEKSEMTQKDKPQSSPPPNKREERTEKEKKEMKSNSPKNPKLPIEPNKGGENEGKVDLKKKTENPFVEKAKKSPPKKINKSPPKNTDNPKPIQSKIEGVVNTPKRDRKKESNESMGMWR